MLEIKKFYYQMGTVAHDYNLNIWGSEIGKWEVQGHPQPYSKFEAKMSFMRSHFKKKSKQTKVVEEKRRGREQKERNPWLTRSQDLYFKRAWRWIPGRKECYTERTLRIWTDLLRCPHLNHTLFVQSFLHVSVLQRI